jgi:hypothetical protein
VFERVEGGGATDSYRVGLECLLFVPPLQTCSLWVQVSVFDLSLQIPNDSHGLVQYHQFSLRLLALQVLVAYLSQLFERLVDISYTNPDRQKLREREKTHGVNAKQSMTPRTALF